MNNIAKIARLISEDIKDTHFDINEGIDDSSLGGPLDADSPYELIHNDLVRIYAALNRLGSKLNRIKGKIDIQDRTVVVKAIRTSMDELIKAIEMTRRRAAEGNKPDDEDEGLSLYDYP